MKPKGVGGRKTLSKEEQDAKHWQQFQIILERMRMGEDLARIVASDKKLPQYVTVRAWIAQNEVFRNAYLQAKVVQADAEFEKSSWIYDQLLAGNHDAQTIKVALDIIKWRSARLNPKKYHDAYLEAHDPKSTEVVIRIPELEALRRIQ